MSGLRTQRADGILNITFNRPEKLNAVPPEEVQQILAELADLDGMRAVVFRGAGGRAFSTGMQVAAFDTFDRESARAFIETARDLLAAVRTAEVVTLSVIDGFCLGVGFELALACDLRIATPESRFGLPEIKVGIPSVLDAALTQQYVGLGLAKEIILTGDVYPLSALAPFHVFNAVVARDELETETQRWLGLTLRHSSVAIAAQKRLFETWLNTPLTGGIDISMTEFAGVFEQEETLESFARFRESMQKKT
jgi:enoyl-CoA hydratase